MMHIIESNGALLVEKWFGHDLVKTKLSRNEIWLIAEKDILVL